MFPLCERRQEDVELTIPPPLSVLALFRLLPCFSLSQHMDHPFPTAPEKKALAEEKNLPLNSINLWCVHRARAFAARSDPLPRSSTPPPRPSSVKHRHESAEADLLLAWSVRLLPARVLGSQTCADDLCVPLPSRLLSPTPSRASQSSSRSAADTSIVIVSPSSNADFIPLLVDSHSTGLDCRADRVREQRPEGVPFAHQPVQSLTKLASSQRHVGQGV